MITAFLWVIGGPMALLFAIAMFSDDTNAKRWGVLTLTAMAGLASWQLMA